MGWRAKRRVSGFLLAVFLTLQFLAAVPFLHALVHADCNDPAHECGVTLFAHAQIDACDTAVGVVAASPTPVLHEIASERLFVSLDSPLLPARGPPALS